MDDVQRTISMANGWDIELIVDNDGNLNIYTSNRQGQVSAETIDTNDSKEFYTMLEKK